MAGTGGNKRIRNRRTARIVIIASCLLAALLFFYGQGRKDFLDEARSGTESAVSPFLTIVTMPIRGFEDMVESVRNRTRAHRENARLKQELAQMKDLEARANAMAIKLSRFETILNVDPTSGIPETKIAARAVSEKNGPFVRSVLINAGASKDIKPGYAVMTEEGFLGHIVRVGKRSSRVLHAQDLNSRIAVMSERSQARAIMTGQNADNPSLSFVRIEEDWKAGDQVITSGDDGILPFGLPVGEVKFNKAGDPVVELYVSRNNIDWVWVYPFEPIMAPEMDEAETEPTEVVATEEAG